MKQLLHNLCSTLNEQLDLFKLFLQEEEKKNEILIQRDLRELEKVNRREHKLMEKSEQIELRRSVIVQQLGGKIGISADAKIDEIAVRLTGAEFKSLRDELLTIKDDIYRDIMKLKNINELNNHILRDSLEFFNYSVNVFKNLGREHVTYKMHKERNGRTQKPLFFDKEV